jgi:hypothetical protein
LNALAQPEFFFPRRIRREIINIPDADRFPLGASGHEPGEGFHMQSVVVSSKGRQRHVVPFECGRDNRFGSCQQVEGAAVNAGELAGRLEDADDRTASH